MEHYVHDVVYHLRTFPEFYQSRNSSVIFTPLQIIKFSDGEMEVSIKQSIRGKDVFIFSSASRNSKEISLEENKLELYHAVDALKRSRAGRIILFEPYCTCSRSDRATRRNSVGLWIHYKILENLGVDHIVTYQLHSELSKTIINPSNCAIEDVPGNSLLMEYIAEKYIGDLKTLHQEVQKDWLFCSVDTGGEGVARQFAKAFGTSLIIAHKRRDYSQANKVKEVRILSEDSIKGKKVWIVDDMIDTAASVKRLIEILYAEQVAEVYIAATHPVFSDPGVDRLRQLNVQRMLNRIVVLDTIECDSFLRKQMPFLDIISSSRMSAEIVMTLHEDITMSPFFRETNILQFLHHLVYRK